MAIQILYSRRRAAARRGGSVSYMALLRFRCARWRGVNTLVAYQHRAYGGCRGASASSGIINAQRASATITPAARASAHARAAWREATTRRSVACFCARGRAAAARAASVWRCCGCAEAAKRDAARALAWHGALLRGGSCAARVRAYNNLAHQRRGGSARRARK